MWKRSHLIFGSNIILQPSQLQQPALLLGHSGKIPKANSGSDPPKVAFHWLSITLHVNHLTLYLLLQCDCGSVAYLELPHPFYPLHDLHGVGGYRGNASQFLAFMSGLLLRRNLLCSHDTNLFFIVIQYSSSLFASVWESGKFHGVLPGILWHDW